LPSNSISCGGIDDQAKDKCYADEPQRKVFEIEKGAAVGIIRERDLLLTELVPHQCRRAANFHVGWYFRNEIVGRVSYPPKHQEEAEAGPTIYASRATSVFRNAKENSGADDSHDAYINS